MMTERERVDAALSLVRFELLRATSLHGGFNSGHEGYAVIKEELDELWDDIKGNRRETAILEAIQVAAMGARYIVDLADADTLRALADTNQWLDA